MTNEEIGARALKNYMQIYGLSEADLLESEAEAIKAAAIDYKVERPKAFPLVAEKCALIIVDMQIGFTHRSSPQWIPQAERIVPVLAKFADECRKEKIPVILTTTRTIHPAPNDAQRYCEAMADGNLGGDRLDLVADLTREGDHIVTKHTYDAFYGTDLEPQLRARGIDTIIVSGTMTNYCCEAVARSGFDRGYHVVFLSDLNATDSAVNHEASLQTMRRGFARVMDHLAFLTELRGN